VAASERVVGGLVVVVVVAVVAALAVHRQDFGWESVSFDSCYSSRLLMMMVDHYRYQQ
jgi:hypothetical protein